MRRLRRSSCLLSVCSVSVGIGDGTFPAVCWFKNRRSEQLYVPTHTLTSVQSPVETRLAASPPPARRGKPRLYDRPVRLAATSEYPAAPHARRARSPPAS